MLGLPISCAADRPKEIFGAILILTVPPTLLGASYSA